MISGELEHALQVQKRWGDTVLDVRTFPAGTRQITISATPDQGDLLVPTAPSGEGAIPVLKATEFGLELDLPQGASGQLLYPDGKREAIGKGGPKQVAIPQGGQAQLELGGLGLHFSSKPRALGTISAMWDRLDTTWLNTLMFVAVVAIALVATIQLRPALVAAGDESLHKVPDRYVAFILDRPQAKEKPLTLVSTLTASLDPDQRTQPNERLRGPEGQAGLLNRVKTGKRTAVRAKRQDDRRVISGTGLVAVMQGGGPSGLLPGANSPSLGSDLNTAIGALHGPQPGESGGPGGGIKGNGPGGGMHGTIIGGGDLKTKGRNGGNPDYGRVQRRSNRRPTERAVEIREGRLDVIGPLSMDLIRRVINAHRTQIRYCYSQALIRTPDAQGRITVRFTIGNKGYVNQARVTKSTVHASNLESCITSRVRTWKFPPPRGGGSVIVNYPFLFRVPGKAD